MDRPARLAHNASVAAARSPAARARGLAASVRDPEFVRQFIRFGIVGLANTVIGVTTYRVLLALGVLYVVAAPAAWAVGAVNGYIFNSRWTFAARDTTRARLLYVLVTAGAAGSSSLLVFVFKEGAGLGKFEAFLATLPLVTTASFLANRYWTFSDRD